MSETSTKTAPQTAKTKGGVVAYLQIDGATQAADFYRRAFGAEVAAAHPADDKGRTMHIHLYLNGSSLMLSDSYPEHGASAEKPQGFTMTLIVDDVDRWWKRAIDAGATEVMAPQKMFWGDRYAQLKDPFGVGWAINEPAAQ